MNVLPRRKFLLRTSDAMDKLPAEHPAPAAIASALTLPQYASHEVDGIKMPVSDTFCREPDIAGAAPHCLGTAALLGAAAARAAKVQKRKQRRSDEHISRSTTSAQPPLLRHTATSRKPSPRRWAQVERRRKTDSLSLILLVTAPLLDLRTHNKQEETYERSCGVQWHLRARLHNHDVVIVAPEGATSPTTAVHPLLRAALFQRSASCIPRMARVEALFVYPVKGCRGVAVEEAELTPRGCARAQFQCLQKHE